MRPGSLVSADLAAALSRELLAEDTGTVIEKNRRLESDARRLAERAERAGDYRSWLTALGQIRDALRFQVDFAEFEWVERRTQLVITILVEELAEYPEVRSRILRRMEAAKEQRA